MIKAYKTYWKNSFNFRGKTSRRNYWDTLIIDTVIRVIFTIIFAYVFDQNYYPYAYSMGWQPELEILLAIYLIYNFGSIIPALSMTIRRLRDVGKRWQSIFIILIPVIGSIQMLILLTRRSIDKNDKTFIDAIYCDRYLEEETSYITPQNDSAYKYINKQKNKNNSDSDERRDPAYKYINQQRKNNSGNKELNELFQQQMDSVRETKEIERNIDAEPKTNDEVLASFKELISKQELEEGNNNISGTKNNGSMVENLKFVKLLFEKRLINNIDFKKLKKFIIVETQKNVLEENFKEKMKKLMNLQTIKELIEARSIFENDLIDAEEYDLIRKEILDI